MRRRLTLWSSLALSAGFFGTALAQPPAPPPAEPPPGPALPGQGTEVTDQDLQTFATIYVDLRQMAQEFEARMSAAESQEEAQELQMEMRSESISAIEERGWSPEKYNSVAEAINADRDLIEQAMTYIDEAS